MPKYGRARRESDLARPHPHPYAERPTARIPYAQLRSLVLSLIEPPSAIDDLTQEFEAQPTMFRPRVPPRHSVGPPSDPGLAGDEALEPGRVSTLDALVAELRIANARIMTREPDDPPGAAVTRPATGAQSTLAPQARTQDGRGDELTPPPAAEAQGSRADIAMQRPPAARSSRLDPPVGSGLRHPAPPSAGPGRQAPPGNQPRLPAMTAPPPREPRSGPPATPSARGSRPGLTEPPRGAQGSQADPLMAPTRRPAAVCGEHPVVTPAPRRAQASHVDPLVTPRRAPASHVDPLVTPRRAQGSHVDPLVAPRRAPSPALRRARTEPSVSTRRAQSRTDRSSVTPPPRRARSTINEVNCDLPASDRR